MSDTLTSDQKIEEAIELAKEEIKNGVDNIKEAQEKAMELISFDKIGLDIAKSLGEIPIPPGTPTLILSMRKIALDLIGGKEKLTAAGLTETQINEKITETVASIGFLSLSLVSIASGNLIPAPPSISVAKRYFDIVSDLGIFIEDELAKNEQGESTTTSNESISIL